MPLITILTPTYNRKDLLSRVFESLCNQSCFDFEWLIVDDGSTDGTEQLVETKFKKPSSIFDIRYFKKENGGKHTAVNVGVKNAKGDYIVILDSDDELTSDAIEIISKYSVDIKKQEILGGMAFLMKHKNGKLINKYNKDIFASHNNYTIKYIDTSTIDIRYKYHVTGDICEVFKTNILRKFPFPEIKGEKFCPEVLVWNRIGQKYKLRYFEKVIYKRDYLNGGLTSKMVLIRRQSPTMACMCYKEMMHLQIPVIYKLKAMLNFLRYKINII